jgi:hypothetical protein
MEPFRVKFVEKAGLPSRVRGIRKGEEGVKRATGLGGPRKSLAALKMPCHSERSEQSCPASRRATNERSVRDSSLCSVESQGSRRWDPLTRPAPAGENAGCGPPSPPRGRGTFIPVGEFQAHDHSE